MDTTVAGVSEWINHNIPTPGMVFRWIDSMRMPLRFLPYKLFAQI